LRGLTIPGGEIGRIWRVGGLAWAAFAAQPVLAVGLGDLAKVVLGGKSVLKKAEQKCGSSLALTGSERTTLETAVLAARNALDRNRFLALDKTAEAEAARQSQSATFCPETKKKKKGILGAIGKAGKALIKARVAGGLGI